MGLLQAVKVHRHRLRHADASLRWSASLRASTKTSPTNLRPPRLTETNGDNWQEAVQRYITASAGGRARPPLLLKAIPPLSLCKLPPNPLLSDLAVILLFLPILSPAPSDTSRSGPLPLVVLESARPERRERRGTWTNMAKKKEKKKKFETK